MPQYSFGVGSATILSSGATPIQLGVLQEIQFEFSFTQKELRGGNQIAVDVARGEGKLTGKAKFGQISGGLLSSALAGSVVTPGSVKATQEAKTIPASPGPYTVNVTNQSHFVDDLGVFDPATGNQYTVSTGAPTTGQYSVSAGVYTFSSADAGKSVIVNYSWTDLTTGRTINFDNAPMGSGTIYQLVDFNTFRALGLYLKAYAVTIPKLSLPLKANDYTIQDVDFECFADALGNVLDLSVA